MSKQNLYKINYKKQNIDDRDHMLSITTNSSNKNKYILKTSNNIDNLSIEPLSKINLYRMDPEIIILDQGLIGSCVANAFSLNISYITKNNTQLSRLVHYELCRIFDYTSLNQDDGTYIRTACKILLNYGICDESIFPYSEKNVTNYDLLTPVDTFQNLKLFTKFQYIFIKQDIDSIKAALSNYNSPIIFGFLVYDSFLTSDVSNTGFVPIPDTQKETLQGGHCMNIIGYDDSNQYFICANSWGTSWGANGYCYIPYDFLLNPNLGFDFCVLSLEL
jgi:C1A family cysteine protease